MIKSLPVQNNQARKGVFTALLGALTGISYYGCYWQYSKYLESKKKWQQINQQLENYQPLELEGLDAKFYPWYRNNNLNDWEYKLVKIKGYFKDQRFFIKRSRDGRQGYLVFAPFITALQENDFNLSNDANSTVEYGSLVNLGWVPLENKDDITLDAPIQPLESGEEGEDAEGQVPVAELVGIVRRGESQDILSGRRNWPNDGVYQYIDLNFMAKFHRLFNVDSASQAYIERLVPSYDSEGEELYPVPSTKDNFEKPQQTPQRLLDYSLFWGGAGTVGLLGLASQILI